MKTKWPRICDLPESERKPFEKWLEGQTRPLIEMEITTLQDAYYPWDYKRWKEGKPIID